MNIKNITDEHFKECAKVAGYDYLKTINRPSAYSFNHVKCKNELIVNAIYLTDSDKIEYPEIPHFKQAFYLNLDKFEFSFFDLRKNENLINQAVKNQNLIFKKLIELGYNL